MKRKVHVMITAFRDGFQSCFGARVFTKDFLPALEAAADAGFTHFEAGGEFSEVLKHPGGHLIPTCSGAVRDHLRQFLSRQATRVGAG